MYLSHAPEFENFDTTSFTYVKTFLLVCSVLIIQQVYHVMKFLFITSCSWRDKLIALQVSHVHYFSDGAPSQYKNFKNLANLIHHQDDHQLSAKLHFFSISHDKSPCDGIGGRVKCLVTHSSFQNNHILNADLMYDWCVDNIPGIIFIKINTDDVQIHITKFSLDETYSSANSFQGLRIHNCFIPNYRKWEYFLPIKVHQMSLFPKSKHLLTLLTSCQECMLLAFMMVIGLLEMLRKYLSNRMKYMSNSWKEKGKYFLWPTKTGQRWVPSFNRLGYIKSLLVQGNRSHLYFISHIEHRVYFKLKLSPTSGRCPQWLFYKKFILPKQL